MPRPRGGHSPTEPCGWDWLWLWLICLPPCCSECRWWLCGWQDQFPSWPTSFSGGCSNSSWSHCQCALVDVLQWQTTWTGTGENLVSLIFKDFCCSFVCINLRGQPDAEMKWHNKSSNSTWRQYSYFLFACRCDGNGCICFVMKCQTTVWQGLTMHFILSGKQRSHDFSMMLQQKDHYYCKGNLKREKSWVNCFIVTCFQEEHEVGWWSALLVSWIFLSWCLVSGSLSIATCNSCRTSANLQYVDQILTKFHSILPTFLCKRVKFRSVQTHRLLKAMLASCHVHAPQCMQAASGLPLVSMDLSSGQSSHSMVNAPLE